MRTIKFRGYDKDSKCWRCGNYFLKEDITLCPIYNSREQYEKDKEKNEHHLILMNGFSDWNMPTPYYQSEVDGKSVGQFTGLYDKNDREIYEGDIVDIVENKYIIIFDEEELDFKATNGKKNYGNNFQYLNCCDEIEVIGNTYENIGLLESE